MHLSDEDIARVAHAANNALQGILMDPWASPPWPAAPPSVRARKIQNVGRARDGLTPEELHNAWMRDLRDAGWARGPFKDDVLKTHPDMVPYDDLDEGQQLKDRLFLAICAVLQEETAQA